MMLINAKVENYFSEHPCFAIDKYVYIALLKIE